LNSLAELHIAEGRYSDAEAEERRTLAIWDKSLGPTTSKLLAV
jgi:hypothetical protein